MAGFAFNMEPIVAYFEHQATRAVMNATEIAVKHAQRHAPVRKLFKGTTYTNKGGFRAPRIRRVRDVEQGAERIGHANSLIPLFRSRTGGTTVFFSGDFRRVGGGELGSQRLAKISTGYKPGNIGQASGGPEMFGRGEVKATQPMVPGSQTSGQLTAFTRVKGGKAVMRDPSLVPPLSAHEIKSTKGPVLTQRGRFEVRSGRANFTSPDDGVTRVGGRLRGEIHAEGPESKGGVIWGYVVSATKDPESGRLYPRDQEFGNAHNRPHPFLRPGLQDSRGALKREVRDAVRLGPKRSST